MKRTLTYLISAWGISAPAQEVLLDLQVNPLLQGPAKQALLKTGPADTLKLPFLDDFSGNSPYPDPALWSDNSVFINADYPYNPVTYGAATFDGVRSDGRPYNFSSPTAQGAADTLTSMPLAMDTLKAPGDSALFSFRYQPQGRGNAPEKEDSLVLQFSTPTLGWHTVWAAEGADTNITWFRKVRITIKDTAYFKRGFRFRFRNYATLSGNLDHWHIDYVRLYIPQSASDTLDEDVAFTRRTPSLLKSYRSMPWKHYLANPSSETADSMVIWQRNNYSSVQLVDNGAWILDEAGTTIHSFPTSANNQAGQSDFTYRVPFSFTFPDNAKDSAEFTIVNFKKFTNDLSRNNDTIAGRQLFYNYYAYDDGTAENGYGLNATGAKLAYRFTIAQTDTLRAIQMYFNQQLNDVSGKTFRLTVWDGSTEPGNILYQKTGVRPVYTDSLNKFHTYTLDTVLVVGGTFFVGWVQVTADLLNIGIDRNTVSNDRMLFNTTGTWQTSQLKGSWMIRPVFGDSVVIGTGIGDFHSGGRQQQLKIYPNPASEKIYVGWAGHLAREGNVIVTDVMGRPVLNATIRPGGIDVLALPAGVYFVIYTDSRSGHSETGKFIIQTGP